MGRPKKALPSYLLHKSSGQARVKVHGKDIYLGKYGSPESKREYRKVCAELEATGGVAPPSPKAAPLLVLELASAFLAHARRHYVHPDGTPTDELKYIKSALADAGMLYGHVPAADFGPLALKALQQHWVKANAARTTINGRINRLRRMFKWAASEELVPASVYEALRTVAGLQRGRTAREAEPVKPVPDLHVAATLPSLTPTVRAMVLVHRLTGCRPQDVCRMCAGEIDRTVRPWVYEPKRHKTAYRGATRRVFLGESAQAVLAPLLDKLAPHEPVFSPARANAERYAMMRAKRKTKVQPSQEDRGRSGRAPKSEFTPGLYAKRVRDACIRAGIPHWHPNQLRHSFATEARTRLGLEAAQVALGHSRADVTQVYAERDMGLAAKVAEKMG